MALRGRRPSPWWPELTVTLAALQQASHPKKSGAGSPGRPGSGPRRASVSLGNQSRASAGLTAAPAPTAPAGRDLQPLGPRDARRSGVARRVCGWGMHRRALREALGWEDSGSALRTFRLGDAARAALALSQCLSVCAMGLLGFLKLFICFSVEAGAFFWSRALRTYHLVWQALGCAFSP